MTSHSLRTAQALHLSPTRLVLWILALAGLTVAVIRFIYGIGAVSNMNDAYGWGIWISLDLLCGVALAAGAFTTCAAVHLFGIRRLEPLTRPAVLTGFLGYLMVIVALLVDLGRPERIYYMLIYQNVHSPLFEVGICVMTYTFVLFLEFSPMLFEWLGWRRPARWVHAISLPLIVVGVVLSTLHQSSLGTLFLMMSDKLHPLWHSPLLPVFFFLSATAVGPAMVIVEGSIAAHAYGRKPETGLLGTLAKALPFILGLYLVLKIGELAYTRELHLLFSGGLMPALFWVELSGGVLLPILLFSLPAVRRSPGWLFGSALLVVAGLMLNRFDVGLVAQTRPIGSWYLPSIMEFAVSFGIISAGVLTYDWVARHMALFHEEEVGEHA